MRGRVLVPVVAGVLLIVAVGVLRYRGAHSRMPIARASVGTTPSPSALSGGPITAFKVSCSGLTAQMHLGSSFTLTYNLDATTAHDVALGAALYDSTGADQSDGTGDQDSVSVPKGPSVKSRPVSIPSTLVPGTYEVDGELWPANAIGVGEPLASDTCGSVLVVQ